MKTCLIKTEKVCKSFITDGVTVNVIKNMDLEIYQGDFTVIMGSSGSGKSTLLYLLSGMDKVSSGDVYFKEEDITQKKENELAVLRRDNIGFVFQEMNLIPDLTVQENVISPSYKAGLTNQQKKERLRHLLEQMELTEHENKYPSQLSGGQKQRAAICRGLINQPEVLFADEPTGALNTSTGESVLDIFTQINENGQSIVMVTHDLKAAIRGNRVIYIRDGRIDGELELGAFYNDGSIERENVLYEFLKARGW